MMKTPDSMLPLSSSVLHILLALADGEKHGYAIMQEIGQRTDGAVKMGPGTLYGAIKRLLTAGLVEEIDERPDTELGDERRRYYRVTGLGVRVTRAETERMADLVRMARAHEGLAGPGVA